MNRILYLNQNSGIGPEFWKKVECAYQHAIFGLKYGYVKDEPQNTKERSHGDSSLPNRPGTNTCCHDARCNQPAMKRKSPVKYVHSPLVPAWGDEFDLRYFFASIYPTRFQIRERDLLVAKQLLAVVAVFGVSYVGIYRAAIRAQPRSQILEAVVECLENIGGMGPEVYRVWYAMPQARFAGLSPEGWFLKHEQHELAKLLSVNTPVEEEEVFGEIPFKDEVHIEGDTGPDVDRLIARWSPSNYELETLRNYQMAEQIYGPAARELKGWVKLYLEALEASCRVAGVMEGVVRCAFKVVEVGPQGYRRWYNTPQPEFDQNTPRQWFILHGLHSLATTLEAGLAAN